MSLLVLTGAAFLLVAPAAGGGPPARGPMGDGRSGADPVLFATPDGIEVNLGEAVDLDDDAAVVADSFVGNQTGAVHVYERDAGGPGAWGHVARLSPADLETRDHFGAAVSLDGERLAAGARWHDVVADFDQRGAVYLFERNAGGEGAWGQVAKLVASDGRDDQLFGSALSLSADRLAVGAPGDGSPVDESVYVFERDGSGEWLEVAILVAPGGGGLVQGVGTAVAIDGDRLLVGAPFDGGFGPDGTVWVYARDVAGDWTLSGEIPPPDDEAGGSFGTAVALQGDRALVGKTDPPGAGYLFERDPAGGSWDHVATLRPDLPGPDDEVGERVDLDGGLAIVSAPDRHAARGAVLAFARDVGGPGAWGLAAELRHPERDDRYRLGVASAVDGLEVVAGGAQFDDDFLFDLSTFGPRLAVAGACPGTLGVEITAAAPDREVSLAGSLSPGSSTIPGGDCAGTELALADPVRLDTFTTDELGNLSVELEVGDRPCSAHLQAFVPASCATSNVDRIPLAGEPTRIRYDPGAPADFFRPSTLIRRALGNVFDTAGGTPFAGGTLSGVQLYLRDGGFVNPSARMTLWEYPSDPEAVVPERFLFVPLDGDSTFHSYLLPQPLQVKSSFMLGHLLYYSCYFGCTSSQGSLGVRGATTLSQGYHGFELEWDGFDDRGESFRRKEFNAMIRALGTFGTPPLPVELLPGEGAGEIAPREE